MGRTFTLTAPVLPILYRVSCSNETLPNAPKHYETHTNMSLGSNGVDRVHSLAQTCALIAHVQPVLHRVLCSNETIQNAPKHYKTHQNMSLGSNGVDRRHSLQKNPMRIRGTNFCNNCSCSAYFAPSFMQ